MSTDLLAQDLELPYVIMFPFALISIQREKKRKFYDG